MALEKQLISVNGTALFKFQVKLFLIRKTRDYISLNGDHSFIHSSIHYVRKSFQTTNISYYQGDRNSTPLSANLTKWSSTLKQFVGNLPTNCLSVFDHFMGLALKNALYVVNE